MYTVRCRQGTIYSNSASIWTKFLTVCLSCTVYGILYTVYRSDIDKAQSTTFFYQCFNSRRILFYQCFCLSRIFNSVFTYANLSKRCRQGTTFLSVFLFEQDSWECIYVCIIIYILYTFRCRQGPVFFISVFLLNRISDSVFMYAYIYLVYGTIRCRQGPVRAYAVGYGGLVQGRVYTNQGFLGKI
jgi:hypothetical protein